MVRGAPRPAELLYGQRMSARLAVFCPAASEHLRIAARAQHLERWKLPRPQFVAHLHDVSSPAANLDIQRYCAPGQRSTRCGCSSPLLFAFLLGL
ncbi:MAG: DUF4202 family protein [Alphaproteobacteria bacterium]